MLLEVKNLSVKLENKEILSNISFQLGKWEILSLLWHNGSGKTTLLKAIIGLISSKGEIIFKWKEIQNLSVSERAKLGIGYIMQEVPEYTWITVWNYVKNILEKFNKFDEEKVSSLFDMFWMNWKLYEKRNFDMHLSGWEKKKIEIITSFLLDKQLYLLDEIEVSLDATSRKILADIIKSLQKEWKSFIIVSHHEELINLWENALLLCNWKIQSSWKVKELLDLYLWRCVSCSDIDNCSSFEKNK